MLLVSSRLFRLVPACFFRRSHACLLGFPLFSRVRGLFYQALGRGLVEAMPQLKAVIPAKRSVAAREPGPMSPCGETVIHGSRLSLRAAGMTT